MNVLFVASECAPVVKVGGLADVVGSLPKALIDDMLSAKVMLPLYTPVIDKYKQSLNEIDSGDFVFSGEKKAYTVYAGNIDGIDMLFIGNDEYIGSGEIYPSFGVGTKDSKQIEVERFVFFNRAVVDYLSRSRDWIPDVIHAHDWHTGLLPYLIHEHLDKKIPVILTIHNLGNQGITDLKILEKLGQGRRIEDGVINWDARDDNLDLLLQGILGADLLTTVSPTYAEEITTVEFGHGLDKVLMDNRYKLYGILNGIDNEVWDPATDEMIPVQFNREDPKEVLKGKLKNKAALYEELPMGSADLTKPLVGIVSRITSQKGFDLLKQVEEAVVANDQFAMVALGTGEAEIEEWFRKWSDNSPYIHYVDAFDEALAHKIYAASDMLLIPSRFEPCGLTQMIAMRYGTIPVVRGVGGLYDTVIDGKNGFVFKDYTGNALWQCIMRGVEAFSDTSVWYKFVKHALESDFAWNHSALQYKLLYEKAASFVR